MSLEESLSRIATALEKIAGNMVTKADTGPSQGIDFGKRTKGGETTKPEVGGKAEAKVEAKPEAKTDTPKVDFNKDIRAVFLELLTTAKDRPDIGPKGAADIARGLLKEFTTNPNEPLSAKTLPEDKYDAFIAAVNAKLEQLNDTEEALPGV